MIHRGRFENHPPNGRPDETSFVISISTNLLKLELNHLSTKTVDMEHTVHPDATTIEETKGQITTTQVSGADKISIRNPEVPKWIRLKQKGIFHDNRRLLKHRAKNCECFVCYREIYKLPPAETHEEYVDKLKTKMKAREIKRTIRIAKKEVKKGQQATITSFFRHQ